MLPSTNVDKGLYPKAFCKIISDILGEMKPIVTSCMQMVRARSLRWPTSIGVRRVTSLSGRGIAQDALIT